MAETFYGCERVKKPTQFDGEAKSGPVRVRRSYNIFKFSQTNEQILLTPLHFTSPASVWLPVRAKFPGRGAGASLSGGLTTGVPLGS